MPSIADNPQDVSYGVRMRKALEGLITLGRSLEREVNRLENNLFGGSMAGQPDKDPNPTPVGILPASVEGMELMGKRLERSVDALRSVNDRLAGEEQSSSSASYPGYGTTSVNPGGQRSYT